MICLILGGYEWPEQKSSAKKLSFSLMKLNFCAYLSVVGTKASTIPITKAANKEPSKLTER